MIHRDYYIYRIRNKHREFYESPVKELLKWCGRFMEAITFRYLPWVSRYLQSRYLFKRRAFARNVTQICERWYLKGQNYYEIQIADDTRACLLVNNKHTVQFSHFVKDAEELILGVAPLIPEAGVNNFQEWQFSISILDQEGNALETSKVSLPFGAHTDRYAYFHGDGWLDLKFDLSQYSGQTITILLCYESLGQKPTSSSLSVSAPQILPVKKVHRSRNVIFLSIESFTEPQFLQKRYGAIDLPNFYKLAEDSVHYPRAYSPVDSTLPFAASVFSGLMPSQHSIGDYSRSADGFENKILSENLPTIQNLFKDNRFLTLAGVVDTRFSSKVGWARGFDSYVHHFRRWDKAPMPEFEWILGQMHKFSGHDKFIFSHIDYLHAPLITPANDLADWLLYEHRSLAHSSDTNIQKIYYAHLQIINAKLGILIHSLKARGEYENTAIVLTGDHGCGIQWTKHSEFALGEERIRVPLLIKYPDWATEKLDVLPVCNSVFEIYRAFHAMLGKPIPSSFKALPQYRNPSGRFAFSETIMNPKRQYKKHNLALMDAAYKYVCWNEVNWENFTLEKQTKELLFRWDPVLHTYEEQTDLASTNLEAATQYRNLAYQAINDNLEFLSRNPSRLY